MFNLVWFSTFFVGCAMWGQEVLRNACSCYNNNWDNSPSAREKKKSSIVLA
jgi:hypothetical protein